MMYNFIYLYILGLTLSTTFIPVCSQAELTLIYGDEASRYLVTFDFSAYRYYQFYLCVCGHETLECLVEYQLGSYPFTVLSTIQKKAVTDNHTLSNYFQCKHNASIAVANCKRLEQRDLVCNVSNNFTILPRVNTLECNSDCFGLAWYYPTKEKLVVDSQVQSKTSCQDECYWQTSTTPTTKTNTALTGPKSTTTSLRHETSTTSNTETKHEEDNFMPLIIGVVVCVLVISAIVLVAIVVVWRKRRTRPTSKPETQSSIILNNNGGNEYEEIDAVPWTNAPYRSTDPTRTIDTATDISNHINSIPLSEITTTTFTTDVSNTAVDYDYIDVVEDDEGYLKPKPVLPKIHAIDKEYESCINSLETTSDGISLKASSHCPYAEAFKPRAGFPNSRANSKAFESCINSLETASEGIHLKPSPVLPDCPKY